MEEERRERNEKERKDILSLCDLGLICVYPAFPVAFERKDFWLHETTTEVFFPFLSLSFVFSSYSPTRYFESHNLCDRRIQQFLEFVRITPQHQLNKLLSFLSLFSFFPSLSSLFPLYPLLYLCFQWLQKVLFLLYCPRPPVEAITHLFHLFLQENERERAKGKDFRKENTCKLEERKDEVLESIQQLNYDCWYKPSFLPSEGSSSIDLN